MEAQARMQALTTATGHRDERFARSSAHEPPACAGVSLAHVIRVRRMAPVEQRSHILVDSLTCICSQRVLLHNM